MIVVRLTDDEYKNLIKAASKTDSKALKTKKGKVNLSAYCRDKILRQNKLSSIKSDEMIDELRYQVRKIGVNINQIAKLINAGFGRQSDLDRIIGYQIGLEDKIDEIVKKYEEEI